MKTNKGRINNSDPQRPNDTPRRRHHHHQPSRLQRRAPSSLEINRGVQWNVAIPLLSPLASSPPPIEMDLKPPQEPPQPEKPTSSSFKKWQHPAAPFCCEPPPMVPPFVPV
ncbi:hypothetical protein Fmac_024139 [Flemingia macrophylla]|uniref:Uncharacterized protein n=1 Tax=Flemingia macrophylla TaxID=520843 RepID=A0ABD1LNJ9_9FABA